MTLNIYVDDVNDNFPKFLQMIVMQDEDVEILDSLENKLKHQFGPNEADFESFHSDSEHSDSNLNPSVLLPPVISLSENISAGAPIIRLLARDKDANFSITYKIIKEVVVSPDQKLQVSSASKKHFAVNSETGEVTVGSKLSPETEYHLTVSAFDSGGYADNVTLRIYVKDVNDHAPTFYKSSYDFDLLEGIYSDFFLGSVETADADYGDNANVTYLISSELLNDSSFPFKISPTKGEIFVSGNVDRELKNSYVFEIVATDNAVAEPKLSASVIVEVHVADVNDNSPVFYFYDRLLEVPRYLLEDVDINSEEINETRLIPIYYAAVQENSAIGIPVIKITANDSDFAGNGNGLFLFDVVRKKNMPTFFEIDSKEGIVTVTNKLDYEHVPVHNVTIIASDLGKPSLTSTALLIITIVDVPEEDDDILEPIFDHKYYEVEVEENSFPPLEILTVNVSDKYRGLKLKYSIVPGLDSSEFNINPTNGTLSLLVKPDRETKDKYEIKIKVDKIKRGRGIVSLVYPPSGEKMAGVGEFYV